MKRFLVTGAAGYIGSHMCYELKKEYPDCHIVGVDIDYKEHLLHLFDSFICDDLSDPCSDDLYSNYYDCIFHFAALSNIPEGEKYKLRYYQNNLKSAMNTLHIANMYHTPNFIFSSSCSVYGNTDHHTIDENHSRNPVSTYAMTKKIVEDILIAAQETTDLNVGILRYFNAAGRNVEANLYEEHNPETHLIPILIKSDFVDVYGSDYDTYDGTAIRDYIHVIDLCHAHIAAYKYMEREKNGIVCNVGTGYGLSVLDIINTTNKILYKNIKYMFKPRREGDADRLISDISLMKKLLTFTPKYDIIDILKSMR